MPKVIYLKRLETTALESSHKISTCILHMLNHPLVPSKQESLDFLKVLREANFHLTTYSVCTNACVWTAELHALGTQATHLGTAESPSSLNLPQPDASLVDHALFFK